MFICKFRTVSCRILPNLTLTHCTLFPCFLHHQSYIPPITFLIEKFLIYLLYLTLSVWHFIRQYILHASVLMNSAYSVKELDYDDRNQMQ